MFKIFAKNSEPVIRRGTALQGYPIRMPFVKKERKDNKLLITVEFQRPAWQQLLGAEKVAKKTYALDEYGEEVYTYCSGDIDVKMMAEKFSDKHNISLPESEISVATFLRTLMQKGLVGIEIEKAALKAE